MAPLEAVIEVMLVVKLLQSMKVLVKITVVVLVDNVGIIFMADNFTATSFTKHVEIRPINVKEYVEDGMVEIVFVKSVKNDSNIHTKNLSGDLHVCHNCTIHLHQVCWECKYITWILVPQLFLI